MLTLCRRVIGLSVLTCSLAAPDCSLAAINYLQNPGFDAYDSAHDPTGEYWTFSSNASVWGKMPETPSTVHDGGYSLGLTCVSGTTPNAWQVVTSEPGANWTFSGYVLNSVNHKLSTGSWGLARIDFLDAAGNTLPGGVQTGKLVPFTGDWSQFTLSSVAPDGTTAARFYAMLSPSINNGSGTIFFDQMYATFTPVPESEWTWLVFVVVAFGAFVAIQIRCYRAGGGAVSGR